MVNILDVLEFTFRNLKDEIAYLDMENTVYRQSGAVIHIPETYFDIKQNGFIKRSSLVKNQIVLSKLREYCDSKSLICCSPIFNGFLFSVYDIYGRLIYKNRVVYFDKTNAFVRYVLTKKYGDLIYGKTE